MTRRDFELIAYAVRTAIGPCGDPNCQCAERMRDALAERLAANLPQSNPRFDRERFLRACQAPA